MINHIISCFHMSVLVMEFSHANGQPPRGLESNQYDLKPAMSIVLSALVVALVFIATLSLVIRQCSNSADAPPTASAASGVNQRKSHGLNPDVIDKLPTFTYSVVKDVRIGRDTLECAICLSDFKEDETLRLVPKCNHVFHIECIDMWLASQVTCPVCRANLNQEIIIEMPKQETTSDASDHRNENSPGEIREVRDEVMITKNEILEKFMRSHSTGHSLPVERNMERHTLKLPEEVMRQIVANAKLKRTTSFGVLESEESERSGRETDERSDHWFISMTPPFVMRAGSVEGLKGEAVSNGKKLFESVKMPLSCINFKDDGLGESSGVGRLQI